MSEPGDELTPLPDEQPPNGPRLTRSPYIALGVAAVVVSTVFATVAALASSRDEAAPLPENRGAIESTTFDETEIADPTTATSTPGRSSTPASASSGTPTSTSEEAETGGTGETSTEEEDEDTPTPGRPTRPKPTTPKPPSTSTPPNKPPVAAIGGSGCPEAGYDCSFSGGGSTDPEGGALQYAWDFGDGSTGSGSSVSHTYAAGTYTVTLTVTDNKGQVDIATMPVTVTAPTTTSGN